MAHGYRADATGRSTGRIVQFGQQKHWKMEGAFVRLPLHLLQSPAYQGLNMAAMRVLTFLQIENLTHGGVENGRLHAPHRQLIATGIGKAHVKPALDMLEAFGLIARTSDGKRLGGRPNAARYGLCWLPFHDEPEPRDGFRSIGAIQVKEYLLQARRVRRPRTAAKPSKI